MIIKRFCALFFLSFAAVIAGSGVSDARVKAVCKCNTPETRLPALECHKGDFPVSGESVADAALACSQATSGSGSLSNVQEYGERPAPLKCSGFGPPNPSHLPHHSFDTLNGAYATRICVPTSGRQVEKVYCWLDDPGIIPCFFSVFSNGCPHMSSIAMVIDDKDRYCWLLRSEDVGRKRTFHLQIELAR
jgi:hypothetical protein